jgi:hypothetical protein
VDAAGKVVIVRQLRRGQVLEFFAKLSPCLVGMEACATAHHWARELAKLGHDVKLIPPSYVKAYVRRQKNDAADAAAICEAVSRPSMRFVPIKTVEQQATLAVHRTRALLIEQRTRITNALRAHLAELGLIAETGRGGLAQLIAMVKEDSTLRSLPIAMLEVVRALVAQLAAVQTQIGELDRAIRSPGIPLGTGTGRLDRPRATSELDWRQGTARRNIKARRSLFASSARCRSNGRDPARAAASGEASLDHPVAGEEAGQGRGDRRGQQVGAHRLGDHEQRGHLSAAGTRGSGMK